MFRTVVAGVLVLTLGIAGCGQTQDDPGTPSAFESDYFTVTQTGSGPDVILLPGLASSGAVWDSTVEVFASDYTLHAVQVSGFAGAPARGNQDNTDVLDDLAADLAAYTQSLEDAPVLVGHSLGGLVALKTALLETAALDQIIVVDVLPFFSVLMDEAATAETMGPVSAFMKVTLLGQSDEVFEASQAEALAALTKSAPSRDRALTWSVESDRAVMAQAMSEVIVTDLREDIARITVPTTVIYARDDAIPNMDAVQAFYETLYAPLLNGNIIAVEDALHFIMLDQPDAFHATLSAALNDQL